jgi:hypothetical protein
MCLKSLMSSVVLATALAVTQAHATTVPANDSSPTDLGSFNAGTYNIIGSGEIDLVGPIGSGFDLLPNGVPANYPPGVTYPGYGYFNPSGSNQADSNYGPGGPGILIGELMGTINGGATWFPIGYGTTITIGAPGHIYAQVNDTFYPNNGGSFDASVSATPLPSTWLMLLSGFVGLGFFAYRGTKKRAAAIAAA